MKVTESLDTGNRELLERCLDYCMKHGFIDLTLRSLAKGVGTSHRMLLYHFRSGEELRRALLEAYRHRQIAQWRETLLQVRSREQLESVLREIWKRFSSAKLRPYIMAFFEFYIHCVRESDERHAVRFLTAAIVDWREPIALALQNSGMPLERSRACARFVLDAVRGMLLDNLAGHETAQNEDSLELLISVLRGWLP